jgi:hypothetical protein
MILAFRCFKKISKRAVNIHTPLYKYPYFRKKIIRYEKNLCPMLNGVNRVDK